MENNQLEMEEKPLALFIPVGIGYGEDGNKSLAETLFFLIKDQSPDKIVFFTTELSNKYTLNYLKDFYREEYNNKLSRISTNINIKDVDDFEEIYVSINKQIRKYRNYRVKIDYTSGTKTMTMAACLAATVSQNELIFVSGTRNPEGKIDDEGRFVKKQDMNEVSKTRLFNEIKNLFNNYRFNQGLDMLDSIKVNEANDWKYTKMGYELLFVCYKHWDDFNHEDALAKFSTGFYIDFAEFENQLKRNYNSLKILNNPDHPLYYYYIIASLINNATRRAEEGKYDDAIARLYRCIELIANKSLENEGVDPYDVDVEYIKSKSEKAAEYCSTKLFRGYMGMLKFKSIDAKFTTLYYLNKMNPTAIMYIKNKTQINEMFYVRNNSILGHGLDAKTLKEYLDFKEIVMDLFSVITSDYEDIIRETKFPKFK